MQENYKSQMTPHGELETYIMVEGDIRALVANLYKPDGTYFYFDEDCDEAEYNKALSQMAKGNVSHKFIVKVD